MLEYLYQGLYCTVQANLSPGYIKWTPTWSRRRMRLSWDWPRRRRWWRGRSTSGRGRRSRWWKAGWTYEAIRNCISSIPRCSIPKINKKFESYVVVLPKFVWNYKWLLCQPKFDGFPGLQDVGEEECPAEGHVVEVEQRRPVGEDRVDVDLFDVRLVRDHVLWHLQKFEL